MNDPMERIMRDALDRAHIRYRTDDGGGNPYGLDFHLLDHDLHIEVKQFHSDRIAAQMARAPNVIVAQGRPAVEWLAKLIAPEQPVAEPVEGLPMVGRMKRADAAALVFSMMTPPDVEQSEGKS